ncbi:MAG: F0F1 ATP synthase subunit gamma [Rickettsiales bacterium]|jgi:F-type H+-transporting ATPase subunit gamma|nr:F0F1 ATP synthase subunit gamma [Rickettsiales bacterium]
MDNLNTLKNDLESTKELKKIISTMKTLAMANIKIYEKIVFNLLKYQSNVDLGLQAILNQRPEAIDYIDYVRGPHENEKTGTSRKAIALIIGSNQGLCGKFNDRVVDFFLGNVKSQGNDYIVTVGNRVNTLASAKQIRVDRHFSMPGSKKQLIWFVYELFNMIEMILDNGELAKVTLYFTNYSARGLGSLTRRRVLPLDRKNFDRLREKKWPTNNIPCWRLDSRKLVSGFIQQYMFTSIYMALANSLASEQMSRIETLHGAEQNIRSRLDEITLKINQTRQNTITTELLDMLSGTKLLLYGSPQRNSYHSGT